MTIHSHWQLKSPVKGVVFDCDGTLSSLEGINVLAEHNNVGDKVTALTAAAMGKTGMNPDLYQERLNLVRPTKEQVIHLGEEYFVNRVADAVDVIQILKRLGKSVYIVSAGLYPAVALFGELLTISQENIFAVNIQFDADGHYVDFDRTSPLVNKNGKRHVITELKKINDPLVFIGDGLNDHEAHDLVHRFIGYGGHFYRENIDSLCDYYIRIPSLAPVLTLALTSSEYELLLPHEKALYDKGYNHFFRRK